MIKPCIYLKEHMITIVNDGLCSHYLLLFTIL
jgi:hypothetical protein